MFVFVLCTKNSIIYKRCTLCLEKDLKGNKVGEEWSCHWCHVGVEADNGDAVVALWVLVP